MIITAHVLSVWSFLMLTDEYMRTFEVRVILQYMLKTYLQLY